MKKAYILLLHGSRRPKEGEIEAIVKTLPEVQQDQLQGPDITLSYVDFARNLESLTAEPKGLRVFQNSADHGFELLDNLPEALDLLFLWLENNL